MAVDTQEKLVTVSIRLSPVLYDYLKAKAEGLHRSLAAQIVFQLEADKIESEPKTKARKG